MTGTRTDQADSCRLLVARVTLATALLSEHAHQPFLLQKAELERKTFGLLHFTASSCLSCSEMLQRMASEVPSPSGNILGLHCTALLTILVLDPDIALKSPGLFITLSEEAKLVEQITHIYYIELRGNGCLCLWSL